MIEEPKKSGFYWVRCSDATTTKPFKAMAARSNARWNLIGRDGWLTWRPFRATFLIDFIEPVTPPSWERK